MLGLLDDEARDLAVGRIGTAAAEHVADVSLVRGEDAEGAFVA